MDKLDDSEANPDYGFKCIHYSVSESAEKVEVIVVRKRVDVGIEQLGIRTVDDTAKDPKDYKKTEEIVKSGQFEKTGDLYTYMFTVPIVNDDEWNPDMDFFIELFNPNLVGDSNDRLPGKDTRCKVTILDEDKPGTIGFQETDIRVSQFAEELEIEIVRQDGSDGRISCSINTEMINKSSSGAKEFDHFFPVGDKLVFNHNETGTKCKIRLIPKQK
jgi:hypothetical protein